MFFVKHLEETFVKIIEDLIKELEQANNLPAYIQNIGLALLGILIPLAIAILTEIYRKKGSSEQELSELDLRVMLDDVFRVKCLLAYALLIFVPFLFWDISNGLFRFFEILLSAIGICMTLRTILRVYDWTKGNVFKYRFSYLKNVKKQTDLETAWESVWKSKNVDVNNELQFFKIFSLLIDDMKAEDKNLATVARLLHDFSNFINNRSSLFLVASNEVFPKILNWNFIAWKKEHEHVSKQEKNTLRTWMYWSEISRHLCSIIVYAEKRALEEEYMICLFLKYFQEHVNIHENTEVKYIEYLLSTFYNTFFENILASSERFAWECFPDEWKITKGNVMDRNNIVVKITFRSFCQWASRRINEIEEHYDRKLDNIVYNLFPEVDPPTWAAILIFVLSPYAPENRVKLAIERNWTFGGFSRIRTLSGDSLAEAEDNIKAQELAEIQNAYELAILLFPNHFSKELLLKYIEDTNKLKYPDNSLEERKRLRLLKIFQDILNILPQND